MRHRAAGANDLGADYKNLGSISAISQISSPSDWENNDAFVEKKLSEGKRFLSGEKRKRKQELVGSH